MPTNAGAIFVANGLALAGETGGIATRGYLRGGPNGSGDPFWEQAVQGNGLESQDWTSGAFAGRTLMARFEGGTAAEIGRVMAAISPLNGPWTMRAHLLFGPSETATVEARVVTVGVRQWQGDIQAEIQQLDSIWRVVTPPAAVAIGVTGSTSWSTAVPFTGAGSAPIVSTVTIDASPGAGVAPNRYSFTIMNKLDRPIIRMPRFVPLGDTSGWTGSTAANTFVFCDGIEVPREVIAMGETRSFLLIVPDRIAPGQVRTFEILTGGSVPAIPTTAQALNGRVKATVPDPGWEVRTASNTGTTSTVTLSGTAMEVNRWKNGAFYKLTGIGAGVEHIAASNTATTITWGGGQPTVSYAAGDRFLLMASWESPAYGELFLNYAVRQTEHSDYPHGIWYQDRAQNAPREVSYDSPATWRQVRSYDNRDDVAQPSTTAVNVGTVDYFGIPNITRTWEHGSTNTSIRERGAADGVTFSSPFPIKRFRCDPKFKNPNGVAKAVIGSRQAQAEDWKLALETSTAYATLTQLADTTYTLQSDTRHLLFAVWPAIGDEIPTTWARDAGARSGGGNTTMSDDEKDWVTNQWVGARWRVTYGKGQGQARTIISNTPVTLTWAASLNPSGGSVNTPNDSSRYEIVQKPLIANLTSGAVWIVTLDVSGSPISGLTSLGAAERVAVRVRVNGGATATTANVRLDVGAGTRKLWTAVGQTVVCDTDAQTAYVMIYGATVVKDVTDWVAAYEQDAVGVVRESAVWLSFQPGASNLYTQRTAGEANHTVSMVLRPGYLG